MPIWFPNKVLRAAGPLLSIILWGRVSEPTIVHDTAHLEVHMGHLC